MGRCEPVRAKAPQPADPTPMMQQRFHIPAQPCRVIGEGLYRGTEANGPHDSRLFAGTQCGLVRNPDGSTGFAA